MMDNSEHSGTSNGPRGAFQFECGEEWIRFRADLQRLGAIITEQIDKALAAVDFEAVGKEMDAALRDMAEELRRAGQSWSAETGKQGPATVRVNVGTEKAKPPADAGAERMAVLNLVAEGKITADEGARLLQALA